MEKSKFAGDFLSQNNTNNFLGGQMESAEVTSDEIVDMVRHWLKTPIGSYLGSDYGYDPVLFLPLSNSGREIIQKLKKDIPILGSVSDNIELFSIPVSPDKTQVYIQIADVTVEVN